MFNGGMLLGQHWGQEIWYVRRLPVQRTAKHKYSHWEWGRASSTTQFPNSSLARRTSSRLAIFQVAKRVEFIIFKPPPPATSKPGSTEIGERGIRRVALHGLPKYHGYAHHWKVLETVLFICFDQINEILLIFNRIFSTVVNNSVDTSNNLIADHFFTFHCPKSELLFYHLT